MANDMTTVTNAYFNALLADAAYVKLTQGIPETDLVRKLGERLTSFQAAYLAANFGGRQRSQLFRQPIYRQFRL